MVGGGKKEIIWEPLCESPGSASCMLHSLITPQPYQVSLSSFYRWAAQGLESLARWPIFFPQDYGKIHKTLDKQNSITHECSGVSLRNSFAVRCHWCKYCNHKQVHVCSVKPSSFRPHGSKATRLYSHQVPLSIEFPRQEHRSGLSFPLPGDIPDPGIEPKSPVSPALQVDSLLLSHWRSPLAHETYLNLWKGKRQKLKLRLFPLEWFSLTHLPNSM